MAIGTFEIGTVEQQVARKRKKAAIGLLEFMTCSFWGEKGLFYIFSEVSRNDPKNIRNWLKNGSFEKKMIRAAENNLEFSEKERKLILSLFSGDFDLELASEFIPKVGLVLMEIWTQFERDGVSEIYQEYLDEIVSRYPSVTEISNVEEYYIEAVIVFSFILNKVGVLDVNVLQNMTRLWRGCNKSEISTPDRLLRNMSSYFFSILADIFVCRWQINKGEFYQIVTDLDDPESANRTWCRWKKGSIKGNWAFLKRVLENLSKDERFTQKDWWDIYLLGLKIGLTFMILIIRDHSRRIPEDFDFHINNIDRLSLIA